MSKYGFTILKLELTGGTVPTAEITFKNGLNVITGASDTGKSFILQCIDYMFGAKNPPKKIDEAENYKEICLTLKVNKNSENYILKRSLNKAGLITVSTSNDKPDFTLKPTSDPNNKDNVSIFLLGLTGLTDKKVKKNNKNEKVNLSFRDLSHLCVVSEEKIITEASPIFTLNLVNHTKEKSIFSLLLTGEDDSELITIEDKKTASLKKSAKIEILEEIIGKFSENEESYPELIEIELQTTKMNTHYEILENQLADLTYTMDLQEQQRQILWKSVQSLNSELHTRSVLLERFELLEIKYNSDLERLNSTIEANSIFDSLPSNNCFFCDAVPEHQNYLTLKSYDAEKIEGACIQEIRNIETLKKELEFTLNEVKENYHELVNSLDEEQAKLILIEQEIKERLKPSIIRLLKTIQSTQEAISDQKNRHSYVEKINYLKEKVNNINIPATNTTKSADIERQITREVNTFCIEIEDRVKEWDLFENPRIGFNNHNSVWDITISGKERSSYGKGFRALTYTAFSLALLKYCIKKHLPHPGFVIVDSPLVVFKEPEPDIKGKEKNIKYNFFNDILLEFKNEQVIIFENEDVPENLKLSMHLIEFTKNQNTGRYGFIPVI